jgi:hypothetical protein
MSPAHQEIALVRRQHLDDESGRILDRRRRRDDEVELATPQRGEQRDPVVVDEAEAHPRAAAQERRDGGGHEQRRREGARSDDEAAGPGSAHQRHFAVHRLRTTEQLARLGDEDAAEVGRLDAVRPTVEQLDAGATLELLDAARQRRLRQVQRARRAREASFLRERPGVPQEPEVEVHARMLSKP